MPFFDDRMEKYAGYVSIKTPGKFVVQQSTPVAWHSQDPVTFSQTIHCFFWKCDISSGLFTVPKTTYYIFVVSGTARRTDAAISIYKKNPRVFPVKLEDLLETGAGQYSLKETIDRVVSTYSGWAIHGAL